SSYFTIDDGSWGFFRFHNRQTIFSKLGGYDEKMYGWGSEDLDFICRSTLAGMISRKIDDFDVYHKSHGYDNNWRSPESEKNNSDACNYNTNQKIIKIEDTLGEVIEHENQ
ncbi:MAG: glycosyltransferase family 2 protein, partial [Bacillota bacterium]